jgi:hypothetical protein
MVSKCAMWVPVFVLLFSVAAACGGDQEADAAGLPELDRTDEVQVCVRIGLDDEDNVYFGSILSAVRGGDGSVYVLDRQALEVHRFDREGRHLASFGREGEGPGEMTRPVTMVYAGGSVKVWDQQLSRITRYSPLGEVETVQPVDAVAMMAEFPRAWLLPGGDWLYADYRPPEVDLDGIRGGEQVRGSVHLMKWSGLESGWKPVMEAPGRDVVLYVLPNGVRGALPGPLAKEPMWAPAGEREFWYADTGSYSVMRMNLDGDTVAEISPAFGAEPSTGEDREAYMDMFGASSPELRRVVEDVTFPEYRPALQGLRVATTGEVWVQPVVSETQSWHVFSPEGDPLFKVELPDERRLEFVQGDTLVAVGTDPLGVQFVETLVLDQSGDGCNGR